MCSILLKVEKLPESSSVSQFELLTFKSYRENNFLVYPGIAFSSFVQHMEVLFCVLFSRVNC